MKGPKFIIRNLSEAILGYLQAESRPGAFITRLLLVNPDMQHSADCEAEATVEPTTDVQTTDRRGKRITNPRYMKTLYGVEATVTVTCGQCGGTGEATLSASEAASAFDEQV